MRRKFLAAALVIVGALMASAMAAQDTSGMRYTSASEGFYASLRAQFSSGATDDAGFSIENSSSRFGVRGTNDLGGGLEGFYQYEAGIGIDNGSGLSTRLGHVGVRGGFGQLQVGTFWPASYSWVHGSTDVANWASGSFIGAMLLPSRQSRALEYTTPDLNGFQAAVFIEMDSGRDGEGALSPATTTTTVSFRDSYTNADINLRRSEYNALDSVSDADARVSLLRRFLVAPTTITLGTLSNTQPLSPAVENGVTLYNIEIDDFIDVLALNPRMVIGPTGATIATESGASQFKFNTGGGFTDDPGIFGFRTYTGTMTITGGNPKDDNDIDLWSLSSKYSFHGFDAGISYTVAPDGIEKSSGSRKDLSLYALRFGYAQDNWYVTSWYAEDNAGDDVNRDHDTETFSLAAGIAVGKTNLYAVYETQESDNYDPESPTVASSGSEEDEVATIGMQYNLGSRSRLWIEYASRDYDSNPDADDYTTIGLRHDL